MLAGDAIDIDITLISCSRNWKTNDINESH